MTTEPAEWHPGSFTKNYSWGPTGAGLQQLHEAIRVGFDNKVENVTRTEFRERIRPLGRPDYIPINFFLYNSIISGVDWIIADELVFQAINFGHSKRFDSLALFSFNFSLVGHWKGARAYQSRPALWAHHYISERFGPELQWEAERATADDIQSFVTKNPRYTGEGSRKLSTNLAYLYSQAGLESLKSKRIERWWVDALFLALDRILLDRAAKNIPLIESNYESYLLGSGFFQVAGNRSIEKDLASKHLVRLYQSCGGINRFDDDAVRERSQVLLNHISNYVEKSHDMVGAVHATNLRVLKSLPEVCSALARFAGFDTFDLEDLENMNTSELARTNVKRALEKLKADGIRPDITSEQLMRIMRGE